MSHSGTPFRGNLSDIDIAALREFIAIVEAGGFLNNPPALVMLHPPSQTRPSLPGFSWTST